MESVKEKNKENIVLKFIADNKRIILFSISIFLFCLIVFFIFRENIDRFDNGIYEFISKIINDGLTAFACVFTHCGSGIVIIPTCVLLFIFLKDKVMAHFIILNIGVGVALNLILKQIFLRPRPEILRLTKASGYSFPSGHSMVSMAFYGYLIYLICKNVKNKYLKWIAITALTIMIALIGFSRIYLGVHYASDVLAGFCFSIAYLIIYTTAISNKLITMKSTKK